MRKYLLSYLILVLLLACNSREPSSIDPKVDLKNVLITGASISANWKGVDSPGLKIAKAYKSETTGPHR